MLIAAASFCTEQAFRWSQLLHPLCGNGYQSWSGILSDVGEYTVAIAVLTGFAAWWRKHNCHVHRCWRLQWHAHPEHGHPVCSVHHPDGHHGLLWRIVRRCRLPVDHLLDPARHDYRHHRRPEGAA